MQKSQSLKIFLKNVQFLELNCYFWSHFTSNDFEENGNYVQKKLLLKYYFISTLVETQDLERGGKRLKFGTLQQNNAAATAERIAKNRRTGENRQTVKKPRIAAENLTEGSLIRCQILRQFGIMWLAPFCHRNPGRFNFSHIF